MRHRTYAGTISCVLRRLRSISPATVIALLALFVSLTGTATAITIITGRNVKDGSLTGQDVKDRSLTRSDLSIGTLTRGPAGPAGGRGSRGDRGRRDAELLFERLDALSELEHGNALELLDPLCCGSSHVVLPPGCRFG